MFPTPRQIPVCHLPVRSWPVWELTDFPIISPLIGSVATFDLPTLPKPVTAACSVSSNVTPNPADIPFPSSSAYVLHICERSSPDELGWRSTLGYTLRYLLVPLRNDFVACLMRRATMEAKRCSNRTVF